MRPHDEDADVREAEDYFRDIDSLRIMELVVMVESKFKVEIPTSDLLSLDDKDFFKFSNIIEKELGVN